MTQCTSIADTHAPRSNVRLAPKTRLVWTYVFFPFFRRQARQIKVMPKLVRQNSDRICRILQVVPNGPLYFAPCRSLTYLLVFRSCDFAFSCKRSGRCEPPTRAFLSITSTTVTTGFALSIFSPLCLAICMAGFWRNDSERKYRFLMSSAEAKIMCGNTTFA